MPKPKHPRFDDSAILEAVKRYPKLSYSHIGRKFGCSYAKVSNVAVKAGIVRNPKLLGNRFAEGVDRRGQSAPKGQPPKQQPTAILQKADSMPTRAELAHALKLVVDMLDKVVQ